MNETHETTANDGFYVVRFKVTEVTIRELTIRADSEDQAKSLVESYEFDNCDAEEVDSVGWEVSEVEVGVDR